MFSYMKRGREFYREVTALSIPIILQNLITNSLGLLDTFMVGQLGQEPMAAVTLANIPSFVVLLMVFGMQSGSSVLISQFYGKGDYDSISRVLGIGFYLAGGVNFIFGCIMFFLPGPFMALFGNDAAVVALAARYAKWVAFSFFFEGLTQVYIAAHRSMANPKLGLFILGSAMVSNTLLNYILIFGKLGLPALGVEGAAIATLLSRIIEFLIALCHILFNRSFRVRPSQLFRPGQAILAKYVRYATPVVLNETLWGLGTALYPTIMGHMAGSADILAAFGIAGNLEKVTTVFVYGVSGAAAIIIGREIGAGRRDTAYEVGLALDTLAFLMGLAVGGLLVGATLLFFGPMVYPRFGLSPAAQHIATIMSLITFASLPVRAFDNANIVGVLRGGGDVRAAMVLDIGALWLVSIPLAALSGLVFQWGIVAVYLCITLENVVKAIGGVIRLRSGKWVRDVTAA